MDRKNGKNWKFTALCEAHAFSGVVHDPLSHRVPGGIAYLEQISIVVEIVALRIIQFVVSCVVDFLWFWAGHESHNLTKKEEQKRNRYFHKQRHFPMFFPYDHIFFHQQLKNSPVFSHFSSFPKSLCASMRTLLYLWYATKSVIRLLEKPC